MRNRLAAIRHLFDGLVTGQMVPVKLAASVRRPCHVAPPKVRFAVDSPLEGRWIRTLGSPTVRRGSELRRSYRRKLLGRGVCHCQFEGHPAIGRQSISTR